MSKRISIIISAVMFVSALYAQQSISDINRIKRDKSYVYGEATLDSKEAAKKLAYELLEADIKRWAIQKSPKINSVLVSKVYEYADSIILPRHNMVRFFAYVKISNLKVIKGKTMTVEVCQDVPITKPIAESSVEEKTEQSQDSATSQQEPAPMAEQSATPIAEPEVVKPSLEEDVLNRLMSVSSFYDLEKTMKPLKDAGKIIDYGKYTTITDPENCYLIIYDQQAAIKAFLSKGTTSRQNLKTHADDSEKNYHGCGAIWFKIKE